jgi:hypothetical protein
LEARDLDVYRFSDFRLDAQYRFIRKLTALRAAADIRRPDAWLPS